MRALETDRQKKNEGYKFKTSAWIHGQGDDYCVDIYTVVKPSVSFIKSEIRKLGGVVFDDYTTVAI